MCENAKQLDAEYKMYFVQTGLSYLSYDSATSSNDTSPTCEKKSSKNKEEKLQEAEH